MTISFFGFPSFIILLFLVPNVDSISFNFDFSDPDFDQFDNIQLQGDALWNRTVLYLTKDFLNGDPTNSVGRASYKQPMLLWNNTSDEVTNFTTSFTFFIKTMNSSYFSGMPNGDGITFFLAPFPSQIPEKNVTGGCLALISLCTNSSAPIVAVEFDTHKNTFDPSGDHVGIDVTNMTSIAYENTRPMKTGETKISATVDYNGATEILSVSLSFDDDPSNVTSVSHIVHMKSVFNDSLVAFGFSSATGNDLELHQIFRWSFTSSFESNSSSKTNSSSELNNFPGQQFNMKVVLGLSIGLGFSMIIIVGLSCCCCFRWYCSESKKEEDEEPMLHNGLDLGPKKISYRELDDATCKFNEENKLGQGGFGSVYKGCLENSNRYVAIKKLSEDSKQGEKEFISEVTVISKLAHKNLVELRGWCHEGKSYLLVYEFMPNGSLDKYLYNAEQPLSWLARYKIAIDVADAILYLHEKYRKRVIHRDIKPSNVMLDPMFNAKLGDFGLARFVDHDQTMKTTHLAGTPGYVAPECFQTGKATTLSDVFSYGVMLLEMSCGKPPNFSPEGVTGGLVEWVWDLYGKNSILDAADPLLNDAFDVRQMECVMVVGLWCAHPDYNQRPPISQAIQVLSGESQLPSLPCSMPRPAFVTSENGFVSSSRTSSYGSSASTIQRGRS
ncbi:hypothetical protein LUZ60_013804 [Juncus effusus]|nr:hypothetical protein LUZ60_013804 [Juncus effusus]